MYYTCSLASGVVWQGCHDPDCRTYRGDDILLSDWTLSWVSQMTEWDDSQSQNKEIYSQMDDSDDQALLEASYEY